MSAMVTLGERLRRRRIEIGESIDRIANETKISGRMLEAIEADDFDRLPGGIFRKKFVLQYARALGLEAADLEREIAQISLFDAEPKIPGEQSAREPKDLPVIAPERDWSKLATSASSFGFVLLVILACAGLYTWWQQASAPPTSVVAQTPVIPPRKTEPTQQPAPPPAETPAPEAKAQEPASAPAAPMEAVPPAGTPQPVRVTLAAGEEVWVQASSDGKRVYSDALQANETKTIQASETVRLLLGNAGGVDISLNGKPIGPVGPRGQVRIVEFTPSGYQIVSRKPPTPEPL